MVEVARPDGGGRRPKSQPTKWTVAAALQVKQNQGSESKILEDPRVSKSQSFPSCAENINSISSWDFEN